MLGSRYLIAALLMFPLPAFAAEKASVLPFYASLRADKVNLHEGPGEKFPVDWVFMRKGLPVEVLRVYEGWWKVRDWQGTEGWVAQRLVSETRTIIVVGEVRRLKSSSEAGAPALALVDPGVVARLIECRPQWCRVEAGGMKGWLQRTEIWGVGPDERVP